ncbi:MAG: Rieske (2Fe-2S) protein [Spirochaetia bacterium]|nr:Rieske (2Fe-2S) protein [Spirochaetia bacterium]
MCPALKPEENGISRKGFIRSVLAMGGLAISYGTFGAFIMRYLWPVKKNTKQKIYVSSAKNIRVGETVTFSTPQGETYILTNREVDGKNTFSAYSNRCPHLGCKVIWEHASSRFYCPCHGGVFNEKGVAIAGPPAKANQSLKKCDIEVIDSAIYALSG